MNIKLQPMSFASQLSVRRLLMYAAFFCVSVGLTVPVQPANAIGVSPPSIQVNQFLRDTVQQREVTISKSPDDFNVPVTITVDITGELAGFISGDPEFTIPAGESSYRYQFDVSAEDIANGDYTGNIQFSEQLSNSVFEGAEGPTIGVLNAVIFGMGITVDDTEVLEYDVINFQPGETEVGLPLFMEYTVENSGNVNWTPQEIVVNLVDTEDPANTASITVDERLATFGPGATDTVKVQTDHDLLPATYNATAQFYYRDELVAEIPAQPFGVYAPGTLAQRGELVGVSTNKGSYAVGETVKFDAQFKNTGEVPVDGVLVTTIYRDGEYIDVKRSEALLVDPVDENTFSELITIDKHGEYTLEAYIEYGNRRTQSENISITGIKDNAIPLSVWVIIALSVLVLIIVIIIRKRRKEESGTAARKVKKTATKKPATTKKVVKKKSAAKKAKSRSTKRTSKKSKATSKKKPATRTRKKATTSPKTTTKKAATKRKRTAKKGTAKSTAKKK